MLRKINSHNEVTVDGFIYKVGTAVKLSSTVGDPIEGIISSIHTVDGEEESTKVNITGALEVSRINPHKMGTRSIEVLTDVSIDLYGSLALINKHREAREKLPVNFTCDITPENCTEFIASAILNGYEVRIPPPYNQQAWMAGRFEYELVIQAIHDPEIMGSIDGMQAISIGNSNTILITPKLPQALYETEDITADEFIRGDCE